MVQPLPAYKGEESYVFVSYAHGDENAVFQEIGRLQARGINVWYDTTGIGLGSEWGDEIARAIQGAGRFLYFITPRSVESEHCRRELNFAQAEGRSVMAVHLEPTEVPPGLRLSLENRQAIFRYRLTEKEYLATLVESLTSGQPATSLAPSALEAQPRRRSWIGLWAVSLLIAATVGWIAVRQYGPSDVQQVDEETAAAPPPLQLGQEITTISVSSFEDSSPESGMVWLAEGLAAQLRNELARIEGLSVVPAGVPGAAALEGTVQVSGNTAVVFLEMVDPASGSILWSQEFTGSAESPMEMQERVLVQIVRVLERSLRTDTPAQPRGQAAQVAWLRSLAAGVATGEPASRKYWLERVIAEDPRFAPAYLNAFWVYLQHARAYAEPAWTIKAADALDAAEELGLGGHWQWNMAKGAYLWQFDNDFDAAEAYLRRSLLAGGWGHQYAQWMLASGLVQEARDYMEQAVESRPYTPTMWTTLFNARALDGDVEGAYEASIEASKLLPPDTIYARYGQRWSLPRLGRLEEAERELAQLKKQLRRLQRFPELRLGELSLEFDLALSRGDRARAAEVAAILESEGWHQNAGVSFLILEDDRATRALAAGAKPPFYRLNHLPVSLARLSPVQREDPRIRKMLDAMGFTNEWRLELCRRISTLPRETGFACDPRRYAPYANPVLPPDRRQ